MNYSDVTNLIEPTLAREIYMMAKKYDDVIDFTIGDPDIPTPIAICDASYKSSCAGFTRYSPNAGINELREIISKHINDMYCLNYSMNNIAITLGAMQALYLVLMALINKDDEVLILAPYWIQYENMVKIFGGKPIIIDKFKHNFEPDINVITGSISSKTKAIIINSPNNPSGELYSEEFLKELTEISNTMNIFIISDEVYSTLVYGCEYISIARFCKSPLLIQINSFSKAFAMTGWRVGYVASNTKLIEHVIKLQQNVANCAATPSQYAALEAMKFYDSYTSQIKEEFQRRRDKLVYELEKVPYIDFNIPSGTFYVFIDISKTGITSKEFSISLLEKEHVAVIPGVAFGKAFDNYIRLAFTVNELLIERGIERIKRFLEGVEVNKNE